jgi:hypothetical protein
MAMTTMWGRVSNPTDYAKGKDDNKRRGRHAVPFFYTRKGFINM